MSSDAFYRCDVEAVALWLSGRTLRPVMMPSLLLAKTFFDALKFKVNAKAMQHLKSRPLEKMADLEPAIEDAVAEAIQGFVLRTIQSADDLALAAEYIAERALLGDTRFFHRLSETLRTGGNPWFEPLDVVILSNWTWNHHWHPIASTTGELTLPDHLRFPLMHWSDSAALEFVRHFSGMGPNLSEAAYIQRRRRWGLRPTGQRSVKAAKIEHIENPVTIDSFWSGRTKKLGKLSGQKGGVRSSEGSRTTE